MILLLPIHSHHLPSPPAMPSFPTGCSVRMLSSLRSGPDGSMDQAVEGLALEYRLALLIFIVGLIFFYLSASFFVWMEDIEVC